MSYGAPGWETLVTAQAAGTALTAAAASSCIPAAAKFGLPANFFKYAGQQLIIKASGQISCVMTTPGTARYDVRFGAGGTVVADSLAMPLNIVAKVAVGWDLELLLTCRLIGPAGNLMAQGTWKSEAIVGSPLPSVGGSGLYVLPYHSNDGVAPPVGANFDTTAVQIVDLFFTQTVATGSMTLHQYSLISPN
jgi:hypothetical protein